MTQEEADNLIKYIEDNTWTGNSSPANWGYCKTAPVVDSAPLIKKIKKMIQKNDNV